MPQVILIDPPNKSKNVRPQLGTLYLAGMLVKQHISVEIIDFVTDQTAQERLSDYLQDSELICIGISAVIGPMLAGGLAVAGYIKSKRPEIPIVWGGPHPTTAPESTLSHGLVNAVCIGEGEETFLEMVQVLACKKSLKGIRGIGYKEDGKMFFNSKRENYFDLNTLPQIPYHLLDLTPYRIEPGGYFPVFTGERIMSIETSRSCSFRCKYCIQSVKKEKYRGMNADAVLGHLEDIVNLGVRSITINDDNFFVDKKRAFDILHSIIKQNWNLEIYAGARSDFLASASDDEYEIMKRAGIKMFGIGVESGSNEILEKLGKGETIQTTFEANKRLAKAGISAWHNFIVGFPGETQLDIVQTHHAMIQLLKDNPLAQVPLNKLIPIPSTPVYDKCVQSGWHSPETVEEWATVIQDTRSTRPAYFDPEVEEWYTQYLGKSCYTIDTVEELEFVKKSDVKNMARGFERYSALGRIVGAINEHGSLADMLRKSNIASVSIYGLETLGKYLVHELKQQGISIAYIVDNSVSTTEKYYCGIPVVSSDAMPVDSSLQLMIVSLIHEYPLLHDALRKTHPQLCVKSVQDLVDNLQFSAI